MIRVPAPPLKKTLAALLAALILCGWISAAPAAPLATIELKPVTQRDTNLSGNPVYNQIASGLNVTAIGVKVYMEAEPTTTALSGYKWQLLSQPSGSTTTLSMTTGTLVTLTPDKVGTYQVALIPQLANKSTTATVQLIRAATWAGVGTINTHATPHPVAPNCGTGFCHGGSNATAALNVLPDWQKSGHSTKMIRDLNGGAPTYKASCLQCHTLGYDTATGAVNNGFDDLAKALNYDLTKMIPQLASEAAATGLPQFPNLPAQLQAMSNIQCEACHGPGSQHPSHLADADHGIAGADLTAKACAQCHDASSGHHQIWWQWSGSAHPEINTMENYDTSMRSTCSKCHSGNGFVDTRINGKPTVGYDKSVSVGATCTVCHDPHESAYPHQLRTSGDFTFDSGQSYKQATGIDPGTGGLCMNCHNSRVVAVATSMNSYRGAHYGTQGDMLAGINAYDFGQPFAKNSAHSTSATETCVTCHMATAPAGVTPARVGAHTMMMADDKGTTDTADDTLNVANACGACHAGLTTFNRTARADYDGNGQIEGIQTEVKGLMAMLKTEILARFPKATIDPVSKKVTFSSSEYSKLTNLQKGVVYDYNFVQVDGSYGIHNTSYAVQILQRAYTNLVGQPVPGGTVRAPYKGSNEASNWTEYK